MSLPKSVAKERRAHPRIEIDLYGRYQIADNPSAQAKATVLNISGAGICLYTNELLELGQKLKLAVQLQPDKSVDLLVEVVWANQIGNTKRYRLGIKISLLNGEDFENFLCFYYEKMAEHSGQFDT